MFSLFKRLVQVYLLYSMLCGASRARAGSDQFLSDLYGQEKHNRVQLCLKAAEGRQERACAGALLSDDWVGFRAGCLRNHPQDKMLALRHTRGETCQNIAHGYSTVGAREVRAHFYHPYLDLSIVLLDRPYVALDIHPNTTAWTVRRVFNKHEQWNWMKQYMKLSTLTRDPVYHYMLVALNMPSLHSPFLLIGLAVVMPAMILILVFIYVIYYSSPSKIPINDVQDNKNTET